jgi:hypothetical protein
MMPPEIKEADYVVFDDNENWAKFVKGVLIDDLNVYEYKVLVFNRISDLLPQLKEFNRVGLVPVLISDYLFEDPQGLIDDGLHLYAYCRDQGLRVKFILMSSSLPYKHKLEQSGVKYAFSKFEIMDILPAILADSNF